MAEAAADGAAGAPSAGGGVEGPVVRVREGGALVQKRGAAGGGAGPEVRVRGDGRLEQLDEFGDAASAPAPAPAATDGAAAAAKAPEASAAVHPPSPVGGR